MNDAVETRERILSAAADVLAAEGFDGARMRSVAKRAGVSIGLLQHYFETRDGMLCEAVRWKTRDLIAAWSDIDDEDADPWRRLVAFIVSLTVREDLQSRSVMWTEFCVSSGRHAELAESVQAVQEEWRALMVSVIRSGVERGVFHPTMEVEDIADIVVALVDGCEVAVASKASGMQPVRFRSIVLRAAGSLLGLPTSAVAEALDSVPEPSSSAPS